MRKIFLSGLILILTACRGSRSNLPRNQEVSPSSSPSSTPASTSSVTATPNSGKLPKEEEVLDERNSPFPSPSRTSVEMGKLITPTNNWSVYESRDPVFKFQYPPSYGFEVKGPNQTKLDLDAGKQISGTLPPSLQTIVFTSPYLSDFEVVVYYLFPDELNEKYNYNGSCGSQFADENLLNQMFTVKDEDNFDIDVLERRQVFHSELGEEVKVSYCFRGYKSILISLQVGNLNNPVKEETIALFHSIISTLTFGVSYHEEGINLHKIYNP